MQMEGKNRHRLGYEINFFTQLSFPPNRLDGLAFCLAPGYSLTPLIRTRY